MLIPILKAVRGLAAAVVIAFGLATAPPLLAQTGGAAALNADPRTTVVATVGSETVYLVEILEMAQQLPEQYRSLPLSTVYPELLRRAVNARLIAAAGRAAGYADDERVTERLREIEGQIIAEVYLREKISEGITEDMLRDAYAARNASVGDGDEVKAHHILLETEDDAYAVIDDLVNGSDFADLATERSTGPSAASGGDLGWFGANQMVPEFSDAAFSLAPGEFTTEPVKTQFGWHVILVEDRRETESPSFEDVRSQLATEVSQTLLSDLLQDLRRDKAMTLYNYDGGPFQAPPDARN